MFDLFVEADGFLARFATVEGVGVRTLPPLCAAPWPGPNEQTIASFRRFVRDYGSYWGREVPTFSLFRLASVQRQAPTWHGVLHVEQDSGPARCAVNRLPELMGLFLLLRSPEAASVEMAQRLISAWITCVVLLFDVPRDRALVRQEGPRV